MIDLQYTYGGIPKKIFAITNAIIFSTLISFGQEPAPGGVKGASLWKVTEETKNIGARWKSRLAGNSSSALSVKGKLGSINSNHALLLTGGEASVNRTINLGAVPAFSLFTVCQQKDTLREKIILSIESDTSAEVVLTDRRMAVLDIYRYAGFNRAIDQNPKIYSYIQNKSRNKDMLPTKLRLGLQPRNQQLPVSAYTGLIPEIILFERAISPFERQKIESYLALKYGISLNQEFPASYLNSNGVVIWDSEINRYYNNNIAGIGRDDISGLYQAVSESTMTPGVLTIGTESALSDLSFYIWGDNSKPLIFSIGKGVRALKREWRISANNTKHEPLFVETNVMSLNEIDPLDENEVYWMIIDRSGTGEFPFKQNVYYQCQPMLSRRGVIKFSSVIIDDDSSGADVFTLIAAPSFFLRTIIRPPECTQEHSGTIMTEIVGGVPPFKITLNNISDYSVQIQVNEKNSYHVFENISQGSYLINVSDATGKVYSEEIWISNNHPWETVLKEDYLINGDNELHLDASEGMPAVNYCYLWTLPDGSIINSQEITIREPGNYLLSVTDDNNCNSTNRFIVEQAGKSSFEKVELFPNPTNGLFVLRMNMVSKQDVLVSITDISGKILKKKLLTNDKYYRYTDFIGQSGTFIITLYTVNEVVNYKLIVN
ncbi:MAG: T9SS type A sorting domain-containing protein [Bacteroidales bacterium]|nr:T9SS type A sorting domain-containing protein [Bacteroidales bacterium]